MDALERIAKLLDDESPRKRIAAAVVLGELKVKDPAVVSRLVQMAKDPVDAYAEAAVEALGEIVTLKALPVLFDSLGRGKELQAKARAAIAGLGEDALPEIRSRLVNATPEVRAVLSQLLPAVHGRQSFEMALEGLRAQPWDSINKVALSVRQEARTMTEAERRVMKTQCEKFLAKKKSADDEPAVRGIIKILGFLELAETQDLILGYLGPKQPPAIRMEATTALRFALAKGPSKKALRRLMELLLDADPLVGRAARDSLTVLKIGSEFADELAELCASEIGEVALWAIHHLGELAVSEKAAAGKLAARTLLPVARSHERARAEAASKVLAQLPGGDSLLCEALAAAEDETGAQVLADVLAPLSTALAKKDVKRLLEAGGKNLTRHLSVARKQLEPVRAADPEAWAEVLREKAKSLQKKDPARAEAIGNLLGRSMVATPEDRFGLVVQQLAHSSLDPHPRARQRDPSLAELEKLHKEGFKIAEAASKDKKLSDEARYYLGVHFAEKPMFELKNIGAEILEGLATGKTKIAKAAKNKMKLLQL
ncbi:MAG: HEAT repeat domain-containing protein [Archangium sp.]|nr:HEAT repeat domain-containing protein [Archangium sp.]